MKVFICWSEERSKKIAELFADWLPQVIQAVEPWISIDIEKGSRWTPEISTALESSKVGIICLTRENLDNKWILFETGALAKIRGTKVCTFLFELTPSDVQEPLSQFMATIASKEDMFKLIKTINSEVEKVEEKSLSEKTLISVFERCWPDFIDSIQRIISEPKEAKEEIRSDRDILKEILELVRKSYTLERRKRRGTYILADDTKKIDIQKIAYEQFKRLTDEFGVVPEDALRTVRFNLKRDFNLPEQEIQKINELLTLTIESGQQ